MILQIQYTVYSFLGHLILKRHCSPLCYSIETYFTNTGTHVKTIVIINFNREILSKAPPHCSNFSALFEILPAMIFQNFGAGFYKNRMTVHLSRHHKSTENADFLEFLI
jgi:hypothetical protein